ncbi:hypothetical protein [Amycolatopsis sp. CA-128772]|uniref:hypothetical protein n=1 Tax=Amycolatopsis sp. CA-128772 TaxID=2073159 RepID=UPI0011B04534|nr:hypothetical protein [Amycolatopsis sp. CA-128772]
MRNVIDEVPGKFRAVLVQLLRERDPGLLAALQARERPTPDQQEAVIDVMSGAFTEHLGADYEPTARGVLIDDALGAFLARWPAEELDEPRR